MELLGSPASPFVRKVRVLIAEAGIAGVGFTPVTASPLGGDAAINAANPLGKIPVLRLSDGQTIYDSRVITRFLDDHAQAGFYPQSRLWAVLTQEALADGIMEAAVGITYEKRHRDPQMQHGPWIEGQWAKIDRALDHLNQTLPATGDAPADMAQIGIACALAYLDFRHGERDWRKGRANLAAFDARMAARPAFADTRPQG